MEAGESWLSWSPNAEDSINPSNMRMGVKSQHDNRFEITRLSRNLKKRKEIVTSCGFDLILE